MPVSAQVVDASPFRYDDRPADYADRTDLIGRIEDIRLGGDAVAALGGDLRERVETSNVTALGLRYGQASTYDLHRLLVHADVMIDPSLRMFVQLGSEDQVGRRPGPTPLDVDRLDLAQGFVDVGVAAGPGRLTLRAGRAEMSFDDGALIGLRDGPNVRQSWDGARLFYVADKLRLDLFAVRPVDVRRGVFDDRAVVGQALQGIHATTSASNTVALDAFYYRNVTANLVVAGFAGHQRTDTIGVRVRGMTASLDGSVGVMLQGGDAGGREVRAFALHADGGATLGRLPTSPHIGIRIDVLSGGDPRGRRLTTFNALYPNVSYSTEATIEAPANLIQAGTVASIRPASALTVQYTLEGLWRYSSRDAFYAAPLFPLIAPGPDRDRYSGLEQQLRAVWRPGKVLTLTAAIVRFTVGDALRRSGAHDESFAMTSLALRI